MLYASVVAAAILAFNGRDCARALRVDLLLAHLRESGPQQIERAGIVEVAMKC